LNAWASKMVEKQHGRVVKLLGDGLFVIFQSESDAVMACVSIQARLQEKPVYPGGSGHAVQIQMGIESGEVVEIEGDCFGDAVNSAARLADLAGADQILTSQRVRDALLPAERIALRSIGPMYLRGKSDATEIFRVEWKSDQDAEATVMGASMSKKPKIQGLALSYGGHVLRLSVGGDKLSLGRSATASLAINDARVSRVHATVQWQGDQFVLGDVSSFGTWVYMGNQTEPVVLRRADCYLVGQGQIALGCERHVDNAPLVEFSVGV
jgi:adenylate cyclase